MNNLKEAHYLHHLGGAQKHIPRTTVCFNKTQATRQVLFSLNVFVSTQNSLHMPGLCFDKLYLLYVCLNTYKKKTQSLHCIILKMNSK